MTAEMHKQNVELKKVISKLKKRVTSLQVQLYKDVDEDHLDSSSSYRTSATKEDGNGGSRDGGTFGVRSAFRNFSLFGGGAATT